jgi:hypothetical protein
MRTLFGLALFASTLILSSLVSARDPRPGEDVLAINDQEYLEMRGLNVMLAHDFYPEGHQGGVGIIQNGLRVATNGDLRLAPTPGQWDPTPVVGKREVDRAAQEIRVRMSYPDASKDRKGFNPINYPDLKLTYVVKIKPAGKSFRIIVDLDQPLPAAWVGKVGFNLELFPGSLFGKSYRLGDGLGIFPRQAEGDSDATKPLAHGPKLIVAAESDEQRMSIEAVQGGELALLDGRVQHNNGWFVVRSLVSAGATTGAIEWLVTPNAIGNWKSEPVIQISQVGYHPKQEKIAVIELDAHENSPKRVALFRSTDGGLTKIAEKNGNDWGRFLRYRYLQFDFSDVTEPGIYVIGYGDQRSSPFEIGNQVFQRGVWQPTIEYFLPVQMCHMRVSDHYRVWHGLCHLDDALMAPVNHNHFDGYAQGPSTLTSFQSGEHVPGLDRGGWHDAGDYDLRIESQANTVHGLALAWEFFHPTLDETTINQEMRSVEIHRPDGKPDILQQIEHGVISIIGGYNSMGRLYRGIQDSSLRQYTHLGDAHDMTDNRVFDDPDGRTLKALADSAQRGDVVEPHVEGVPAQGAEGSGDDRWVFTEVNPERELETASALAAASRALKGFNDPLGADCLRISRELWTKAKEPKSRLSRLLPAIELYQTTGDVRFAAEILESADEIVENFDRYGWLGARALSLVNDATFTRKITAALKDYRTRVNAREKETPYGVPYKPAIWGAGWEIEHFGVEQYFLHVAAPDIFPEKYLLHALDFVLGCHPGANPASFVSGVGAKSMTVAYGANRADWSYIPGGIVSGTALIRPDFPELLEWPYLWQQGEYCLGRPTSDYVFLVLAADHLLNK